MVDSLWVLERAPSTPTPGPHRRVTWQHTTAGGCSRFAGRNSRRSLALVVGSGVLSTPEKGLLPNLMDGAKSRSPARTAAGIALTLVQYVRSDPIPFGPAVASPFPCVWRRPRLAMAGAGIADKQGASLKPFEYCKVIITYHLIFGMGKRIFSDALPPRSFLSGSPSVGNARPREGRSVPKSLRGSRAVHGYSRPPIRQPPRVVRIRG